MSFARYPAYKDSGVAWLGEVPEHWRVVRLKDVAKVINGYPFDSKFFSADGEFPLIRIRDLDEAETATRYAGKFVAEAAVTSSDVLIGMDGDFNVGQWRGDQPALLNQRMCCVRTDDINRSTILRHALPIPLKRINDITYATTVKHLSSFDVERTRFAFPVEQHEVHAIATFLDRETAKIDALVAEQAKLIALLQEKRQAVISHAVTKGLDPSVPMKDSGVAWLRDVPAHWTRKTIKFALRALIDTEHKTAPFFDDGEYLVVRTSNVKNGLLVLDGAKYTDREGFFEWTKRGAPQPGDIIFTREAPAGEACVVPAGVDLCLGQRTVLFQVDHEQLDAQFAVWSVYAGLASEFIANLSQGSTVPHFNMSDHCCPVKS